MTKKQPEKSKSKLKNEILFEEALDKVESFVYEFKDDYALVGFSEKNLYFMMIKKKELTFTHKNYNSPFMPYEKAETKNFCVFFILKFGKKTSEFMKIAEKLSCPILTLEINDPIAKRVQGI